jgi:hypothetical protein
VVEQSMDWPGRATADIALMTGFISTEPLKEPVPFWRVGRKAYVRVNIFARSAAHDGSVN